MTTAAIQTTWSELLAATLADAGVTTCVLSPGSRSTPLVAALANESRLELVTIIDERAAAFFALGAARATGLPAAIVCTSGTAAAHYLPAIIEASLAGIPLVVITADRPPELQACGASQTIDQIDLYGGFVRGAFDLGAPVAQLPALRGLRRKLVQAITLSRGPHAGPVHIEVPLRKPLEPAQPSTDDERAFARAASDLRGPVAITPPTLAADPSALTALVDAIAAEPDGVIVVGAMPAAFAAHRDAVFALAARAGYPVIAEAGSQLRFGPRPTGTATTATGTASTGTATAATATATGTASTGIANTGTANTGTASTGTANTGTASTGTANTGSASTGTASAAATVAMIDHADLIPIAQRPAPRLILQLGAEPVAASWPAWLAATSARRWVLGGATWSDPDSAAHRVILGDIGAAIATIVAHLGGVERAPAPSTFGDRESTVPGIGGRPENGVRPPFPTATENGGGPLFPTARTVVDENGDKGVGVPFSAPSAAPVHIADRRSSSRIRTTAWLETWRELEARASTAIDLAIDEHARNEVAAVRAAIEAVPAGGVIQIGNSLPIRVVDHLPAGGALRTVLTQRGAAGIDGLIASAAGATRAGKPVLLVLGDVSFAHDLGGLLAARCASAPLAILVVDNRGGQIFAGLPVARAGLGAAFERHFVTAPELDPSAVATALGANAVTAATPAAIGTAISGALAGPGVTVIHAPVSVSGAHDVRRTAIEFFAAPTVRSARSNP